MFLACSSSGPITQYAAPPAAEVGGEVEPGIALYTADPTLYEAALRAQQRMTAAIGELPLRLAQPDTAVSCQPLRADCGFEISFADVVYCRGSSEPALACTSQGVGGSTLGIELQASLAGEELDNRLIHELFHVITWNRAPHARDGLFMEYSFGDERISEGTLEAVCAHFSCNRLVAEESAPGGSGR